jgi:non-heme Fe2+,alpha-ketoglutarate-dependent halogenase
MSRSLSPHALTEAQIRDFHRNGVVGPLPRFLDQGALDELRDACEELVSSRRPHPFYGRFSVRDWHLLWPRMLEAFRHPAIVDRLVQILGEDVTLWRSKIFYKGPGDGHVHWHQDWGWFDGEEIGNARPSLMPSNPRGRHWDATVWIALDDITPDNGALCFAPGTQHTLYPVAMVPMTESGFYYDPFVANLDKDTIIERARNNKLVLDVDTSRLFDGVNPHVMTQAELERYVRGELAQIKASVTEGFEPPPDDALELMTMQRGELVIFTERAMHQSLPNRTERARIAIHARITTSDTLVHPFRLRGECIDGHNLDITPHRCVMLHGRKRNRANVYLDDAPPPLVRHPLLGHRLPELAHAPTQHCWEQRIDARPNAPIDAPIDARAAGLASGAAAELPRSAYVDMAAAAATEVHGPCAVEVEGSEYPQALAPRDGEAHQVQVVYTAERAGAAEVRVYSRPCTSGGAWQLNARLALHIETRRQPSAE